MCLLDCDVVVLNFNGLRDVPRLLDSLEAQTVVPARVLLLDNSSTDGSYEKVLLPRAAANGWYTHRFERNLGFAKAMNWGLANSTGEYVCLLNMDVVLAGNYLAECCSVLSGQHDVGMVSGVIYRLVGGEKTAVVDSLGITLGRNRYYHDIGEGLELKRRDEGITYPFGVCGCAPVYSRKMLDDVSRGEPPFLEVLESYYEDTDLAWRARRCGWKAACTRATQAWHVRGGALVTRKHKALVRNLCHRNHYWIMLLNERPAVLLQDFRHWILREIFLCLKVTWTPGLLLACWQTFCGLPRVLRLRLARSTRYPKLSLREEHALYTTSEGAYRRRVLNRLQRCLPRLGNWER
jgi:GT2 family glycosyltransferase